MQAYIHKVQYYETDKMMITHHSNYIRWMEEARVNWLEQLGKGMDKLEAEGVISPVVSVNCNYKMTTTFPEEIAIEVFVKEFKGVKLILEYEMKRVSDGKMVCTATSEHCFLDANGRIVSLKKEKPEWYEVFAGHIG